ncbi:hypothetical protein MAR_035061 [Mya arenaria]|uniref:B box-type domain-containing protein n=1 Tax=Mya arenaria TaxID=6604 RepID=A0ABY7ELA5_MYAAR|nr:hypothetical protein MAR_035061 [Mya arenaria]
MTMISNALRNSISMSNDSVHVLCDPCRFNGKTTVAIKYCQDCNGHLCPYCVNTHIRVNNTKNHHLSYIFNKRGGTFGSCVPCKRWPGVPCGRGRDQKTSGEVQAVSHRYDKVYNDMDKLPRNYAFHFVPEAVIERFLKGVSDLGLIKDDTSGASGSPGVWKNKDWREKQDDDDKVSATSAAPKHRQKSPRKPLEPQTTAIKQPMGMGELNVRIPTDKKSCSITGAAFLLDDKVVVADATNKKVKVFGADLKPYAHIETQTAPRDVTIVSATEVACTLPNDRLDVECYGICHADGAFYVTSGWSTDKEVQLIDAEGVLKKKLRPEPGVFKCPLCADNNSKGYMGICSSPQGEIYICTLQPNGISKVHTENKRYGSLQSLNTSELEPLITLQTLSKGGQRPRSIAYSWNKSKIVISFVGQSVDVMSIYNV